MNGPSRSGAGLFMEDRSGHQPCDFREGQAVGVSPRGTESFTMYSIVLADGHAAMRQAMKALLNQQADLHLAGESGNGLDSLSLVKRTQPDLLVMDLIKAFEKAQLLQVWQWACYHGFPLDILCLVLRYFSQARRLVSDCCVSDVVQNIHGHSCWLQVGHLVPKNGASVFCGHHVQDVSSCSHQGLCG